MSVTLDELTRRVADAHGGADRLARIRAATVDGTWTLADGRLYRYRMTLNPPGRLHWHFEQAGGVIVNVLDGDRAYRRDADGLTELAGKDVDALRDVHFRWTLAVMVGSIFAHADAELIGPAEVDGKPAVAVRLSRPDRRDLTAFFDPVSGEVLEYDSETHLPDPHVVGHFSPTTLTLRAVTDNYRDFGGLRRMGRLRIIKAGALERVNDFLAVRFHDADPPAELFGPPGPLAPIPALPGEGVGP